jgi:hypothetical protein
MFIRLEKKLIIVSRLSTGTELSEKKISFFFSPSLFSRSVRVLVDII